MDLNSIITINISLGTVTPSRANFGTPLCLAYHAANVDSYRDYSSANGMLSDGFTVNDQAYKLAASVFSQNPRPTTVRVGRLPAPATAHTSTLDLAGMVAGQRVTLTMVKPDGSEVDVDVAYVTSPTATATAVAALDALITASGTVITFTAASNGPRLYIKDITGFGAFKDTTADWGYDTALTSLLNESPEFYGVFLDVNSDANIVDVAAWALANSRIFGASPQVSLPADYTTTANALKTAGNDRAFSLITKSDPEGYGAAGLAGLMFTKNPGSATWAFKSVRGLNPDAWTTAQLATIVLDNTNHYTTTAGIPITYPGKMHSGEWIDVRRGIDWFEARLAERLLALQVNNDKVPFTDAGISMIRNELAGQLAEAEEAGVFDAGWTITVPRALAVPSADRALRNLPGVEFEARLAGAIHTITIVGVVTA